MPILEKKQDKPICFLKNPLLWLGASMSLYLVLMLPQFTDLPLGHDSLYYLGMAQKSALDPSHIFQPDYYHRYHPVHFSLSSLVYLVAAFNKTAHGLVMLLVHALSAWMLFRLVRRLGITGGWASFCAVFFLFFSTQWGSLYDFSQLWRFAEAFFMLVSMTAFLDFVHSGRRKHWVCCFLFYLGALGSGEDAVLLPILFVFIVFLRELNFKKQIAKSCSWTWPFFTLTLIYFLTYVIEGGVGDSPLTLGWHIGVNPFYLIKEYVHMLFIPRVEHLHGFPWQFAGIRVLPLLLIVTFVWFVIQRDPEGSGSMFIRSFHDPVFLSGLATALVMALPYLMIAKPSFAEAWPPVRYLYLSGIGIAMMTGAFAKNLWDCLGRGPSWGFTVGEWPLKKILFGGILVYVLTLNASTNLLIRAKINTDLPYATREEEPVAISFVDQLRSRYEVFPADAIVIIQNTPFTLERLRVLLPIYYEIRSEQIFLSENGQGSHKTPLKSGQGIIALKWVDGKLLEA